ncbi:MAG: ubiquinone-dependent pyruvate dehydrogenase [Sneathiella sp.]
MAAKTVSNILVDTLDSVGVERIYGIIGDSLNGIADALRVNKKIELIHTRHEEAAAFAAGAEAAITGKLAVCAGSCGPGNLHLINGLFDCQRSGVPVLAIASHIPSSEIGSGYFQETHPENLFKECSHYCEIVSQSDQLPRLLGIAIQTAIAKKGVAVLVLSGDISLNAAASSVQIPKITYPQTQVIPSNTELDALAGFLNNSNKITLLCGAGCEGAHDELIKLGNALQSPMVHALRGKEHVEYDNPYDVGMTGLIGFSSGYYAMESCDTLLLLGTSFPYRQFYPTDADIIQIDIDGAQLGKRCHLNLGIVGDVKNTITALLDKIEPHIDDTHLKKARKHYGKARADLDKLAIVNTGSTQVHPQHLAKQISQLADSDAIFTADVGTPVIWAARYFEMNAQRRLLGSFNHGSMANALSQALGAQSVDRNRQVVALCGDGGFSMLMGEILTLTQCKLPVKVIIINNGTLGFVEMEMKATGFLVNGTNLTNPNFAAMANAIGIHSKRVEHPDDVVPALKDCFAHDGPAIIDVVTSHAELAMPPKITKEQIAGFSLYLTKTILNGKGDEIIELLKTNLWR